MNLFQNIAEWFRERRLAWRVWWDHFEGPDVRAWFSHLGGLLDERRQAWRDRAEDLLEPAVPVTGSAKERIALWIARRLGWQNITTYEEFKERIGNFIAYLFSWEPPDFSDTFLFPAIAWFATRPYRQIWGALPALAAMLTLAGTAFLCLVTWDSDRIQLRYQFTVEHALRQNDYHTARVASQHLLEVGGPQSPHLFNLALSFAGLGKRTEAAELLEMTAPMSRPVHAPAHLYAAKTLLSQTNLNAQVLGAVELHLQHVLTLVPESIEASDLLGRLYSQLQQWDRAKTNLVNAARRNPYSAVTLASLLYDRGEREEAARWAESAAKSFPEKVASEDSLALRRAWAKALALQNDFPTALAVLEAGAKRAPHPVYAIAVGDVYYLWAQQVLRTDPENLRALISLLQAGLAASPKNPGLLKMLTDISFRKEADAAPIRAALDKMLAEGQSPEILHFILGSAAWERGERAEAKKHFELAYAADANIAMVANNLAYLLVFGESPEASRALDLMNPLVEKYPLNPNFRDTRGQVLVKLGRWQEAVTDLEAALPHLLKKNQTHTALAAAYRGLGLPALAAEHEQRARSTSDVQTGP